MKRIEDVEPLIRQTPAPVVQEGPHREQLRQQLLAEAQSVAQAPKKMGVFVFGRMSPALKFAAALLAVAALVGAGWAAEKIYEKLTFKQVRLYLGRLPTEEWKLPNGEKMTTTGSFDNVTVPNDPKAVERAQRHHNEMKELIRQKKYKLVQTNQDKDTGGTEYIYTFTYSDGREDRESFSVPLDNVSSWDDYEQKDEEQSRRYQERVNKAIAAGRYRLIDQDVILIHICQDKESQEKFRVQRILRLKGEVEVIALYRPYDFTADEKATAKPQSTWQEHLQAIREGKLELLDVETIPIYKYEVTFEDGKKGIFRYGGGDPLGGAKGK